MQTQSRIAVRALQIHPALFPLAEPSPTYFEKNSFCFIICLIGGSWAKIVFFRNIATHYIIVFLLESELTGLSLLEQMPYGIEILY